jgi:hypothetical protein
LKCKAKGRKPWTMDGRFARMQTLDNGMGGWKRFARTQTLDKVVVCRVGDGLRGWKVCEDGEGLRGRKEGLRGWKGLRGWRRFARTEGWKFCEDANLGQNQKEGLRGRKPWTMDGRFARTQTLDKPNSGYYHSLPVRYTRPLKIATTV